MKIILSSGTPCSIRTSTAFIAEPPVAIHVRKQQYLGQRVKYYRAWGLKVAHIVRQCLEETIDVNLMGPTLCQN